MECKQDCQCEDCRTVRSMTNKTAVSESPSVTRLASLVDLEPLLATSNTGTEPSIRYMIERYYAQHRFKNYEKLADDYLAELERMAS